MNKLLILLLTVILFACNSKTRDYDPDIVPKRTDSITTVNRKVDTVINSAPIVIDLELKRKINAAFALLQKYVNETKIVPENAKNRVIRIWKKISFGKSKIVPGGIEFNVEKKASWDDLLIFFEDVPLSTSGHYAMTSSLVVEGAVRSVINFPSEYVRTRPVSFIASVLFHELMHVEFNKTGYLQGPYDVRENEWNAYSAQLYFLVWAYSDAEKEYQCYHHLIDKYNPPIPEENMAEFEFYFNKVKKLYSPK